MAAIVYTADLPWYRIRLTVTSDIAGSTYTVSGGGYVESLGDVSESVDVSTGDAKLRALSFVAVNIDNLWSDYIFGAAATSVQALLEVSYNAGATYEKLFLGRVDLEQLQYRDYDATETRNRSYDVQATSYLAALDDCPAASALSALVGSVGDSRGTLPAYSTRPDGSPIEDPTYIGSFSANFMPVSSYFYGLLDWIYDTYGVPFRLDTSLLEAEAYNLNTATGYGFDDWHMWHDSNMAGPLAHCFAGTLAGALGTASNGRDMLKWLCQGLGAAVIESTVTISSTVYPSLLLIPRKPTAADAVTGPLPLLLGREYRNGSWVSGGTVVTPDLPIVTASRTNGRKAYNLKGAFATSPQWTAGLDFFTWDATGQGVYRSDAEGKMVQCVGSTNQLFVKTGAATFRAAHKARIVPSQSYFGSSAGYYGVQEALYDYLIGASGALTGFRPGFELTYAGIRGASIDDVRLMKTISIGGDDYLIEGITRRVMDNTMTLSVGKL